MGKSKGPMQQEYQGKRLRFWTADEDGEHQRIGTLSVRKDALRLDWEEHFPKGSITYFRTLDPRIISVLDPAPANSGADFDFMDVLAVRRPAK